ncbi:MAG TPA: hypothetical protein VMX97_10490, partial [Hyphomicrobiaceae bacterium]|nr:hypothetical protein [Hyphomicrobiaceae bacterium]
RLEGHGKKWYFLVNYADCVIMPDAWLAFASRGKKANIAYSLGSVRFDANQTTSQSILEDSKKENFDPNLLPSREAAIQKIVDLRQQQGA